MTTARGVVVLVSVLAAASAARAQLARDRPAELEGVGVTQRLGAALPLELSFTDERGNAVVLGDLFGAGRPVLLTLVYYDCPMLCHLVLDGLVSGVQELGWTPGERFEVITLSIDPAESAVQARRAKQASLERLDRDGAERGWHFLTGRPESIRALADAVGFGYRSLEDRGEFAHPAALFVLTPDGRVSRYLFGTRFEPRTLRLALVEAADGEIGSLVDQFILYCFRYDAEVGRYTPMAWRLMRVAAIGTALILGSLLLTWRVREARARARAKEPA